MATAGTIAAYTHFTNISFFAISVLCFLVYLLHDGFFVFYTPSKYALYVSIAHCFLSISFMGIRGSFVPFSTFMIWTMIVCGLQGTIPSIQMYNRMQAAGKENQQDKKAE